jgi:lysophospholipase L1-like esterase
VHTSKKFRSRLFVWCLTVAMTSVAALVAWEVILGQLILQKPTSQTHGELGRIYGEGLYVQGKEGYGRTFLNELGLRSPSLTDEPIQESERNVLVLGDSYTQAMQVSDEAAFPQRLNELLGQRTRVINAGREGASPADYIALAEYNKNTFDPDVVIVQLNEADFTRDLLSSKQTFYLQETQQGYRLRENKSVVSSNELASRFVGLQSVFNFSVMRIALERVEAMRNNETKDSETKDNEAKAEATTELKVARVEVTQATTQSLEHFVVSELKKVYRQPVLLYIPEIDYFSPNYARPHEAEQRLAEAAQEMGVTFISLLPDYVALYRTRHQTSHGFVNTQPGMGHINPLGHEVAAERLAQALTPQTASHTTSSLVGPRLNQ